MRIRREELIERIKTQDLPAAVLCYGEEAFFHEEILAALRSSYAGEGGWGYEVVDAASLDPAKLLASAGTLSFGGGTKVTVVRSAHKLKNDQLEALQKIVTHPAMQRVVVLMAEKTLRSNDKLLAWARDQKVTLCQLTALKPRELELWLKEQAEARGFSLDANTAGFTIDLSSGNMMALSQMLDKIDLFRGEKTRIDLEDVEDLLHDSFEKGVYDCVRATFAWDRKRASTELHRVLRFDPREGVVQIVRALSREAFTLLKYQEMREKGASKDKILKELRLGARKWLLDREYPERARKWPQDRLHRLLVRLAEVDFAVRVTGRDPEAMLEQIVIGNLAPTSVEEFDEVFV